MVNRLALFSRLRSGRLTPETMNCAGELRQLGAPQSADGLRAVELEPLERCVDRVGAYSQVGFEAAQRLAQRLVGAEVLAGREVVQERFGLVDEQAAEQPVVHQVHPPSIGEYRRVTSCRQP